MITINEKLLEKSTDFLILWDSANLGLFDYTNQMITLSVFIFSSLHCNNNSLLRILLGF